jgi:hypothetical protein
MNVDLDSAPPGTPHWHGIHGPRQVAAEYRFARADDDMAVFARQIG